MGGGKGVALRFQLASETKVKERCTYYEIVGKRKKCAFEISFVNIL